MTASRNQRSCATRMTAASIVCELALEPLERSATSRWFVGSSRRSRSGLAASARASDARVSSPPENVRERPVEVVVGEAEAAHDRLRRGRASRIRPRARAAPVRSPNSGAASHRRGRRRPSPARAAAAPPRPRRRSRAPESAYSRSADVQLERRALVVQRDARPFCERELAALHRRLARERAQQRRLAGAVRPGRARAGRARSTVNDTPSKSGSPGELLAQLGCDEDGHGR